MNIERLFTRPVILSTPAVGSIGPDGEWDEGTPTTETVNAYIEQTSTREVTEGQQTAPGTWWATLPIDATVAATTTLTIIDSGQVFEVAGEPAPRWNPRLRRNEFIRVELAAVTASV